jgi:hypothetical protein
MKRLIFMLMLTAITAIGANAQITMVTSNGNTAGQDTLDNAETLYWTTPVNTITPSTGGKYRISINIANISGTSTFKVITQGTIDGTNWFNMYNIPGTNGVNCDTLQVTAAAPAVWVFNVVPGAVHNVAAATAYGVFTAGQPLTGTQGRVVRIRLKVVGAGTQSTKINNVKCLIQL